MGWLAYKLQHKKKEDNHIKITNGLNNTHIKRGVIKESIQTREFQSIL